MSEYREAEDIFRDSDTIVEAAKSILARAEPGEEGDPAWRYLTVTRKLLEAAVRGAVSSLHYLRPPIEGRPPQDHAVVSLLRDQAGEVSGLQLNFIDIKGRATATEPKRITYSLRPNGCRDGLFHAGGGTGDRCYLAEGYLEKPLAIASLGLGPVYGGGGLNVLGFAIPPEPTVVIVPDRAPAPDEWTKDGKERLLDLHQAAYQRAVDRLILAGKTVLMAAAPDCAHPCKDADAYLIKHGPIRLADLIERAVPAKLSDDGWRKKLAAMAPEEYARRRKELAKELGFSRVADVDDMRRAGKGSDQDMAASAAERAVAVVVNAGAELWCDDGDDSFVTFATDAGASVSAKIPSLRFEDWLRDLYGTAYEREIAPGIMAPGVLPGQAYEEAWKTIRSMARRCPTHKPCIRVGHTDGRLYLDLADKTLDRPFVEVRRTGEIELVASPAVRLVHMAKALPLPAPVMPTDRPAVWSEFDTLSGAAGDRARAVLTRGFLFSTLFQGPHVGAVFTGDPGAGKTTAATIVKAMIDPAKAGARLRPRTIEDFIIGAYGGWLGLFDNLSGIAQDFSDVACKILDSTGISRRTLYTTADETVIELGRPLAFTSINDHLVWSPDLIDREIILHSERIEQDVRIDEDEVLLRTGALRPQLLGLLLQAAATALGRWQDMQLSQRPRRLGVAKWIEAAHAELGLERDEFLEAYVANQETAMRIAATTNPVVATLLDFMEGRAGWTGMSSALYAEMTSLQRTRGPLPPRWPSDVRSFGAVLSRARIALLSLGVEIKRDRDRPGTVLTLKTSRESPPPLYPQPLATHATDATEQDFPGQTTENPEPVATVASVASRRAQKHRRARAKFSNGPLVCVACGGEFSRAIGKRGRPHQKCPACRGLVDRPDGQTAYVGRNAETVHTEEPLATPETPSPEPPIPEPPIKGANGKPKPELLP